MPRPNASIRRPAPSCSTSDGFVTEATTANLLIYTAGQGLIGPPHEKVLPGISLAVLVELAQRAGIPYTERELRPADVAAADEVLLDQHVDFGHSGDAVQRPADRSWQARPGSRDAADGLEPAGGRRHRRPGEPLRHPLEPALVISARHPSPADFGAPTSLPYRGHNPHNRAARSAPRSPRDVKGGMLWLHR